MTSATSSLPSTGERLCETVDIAAGERVLDVAAGNGDTSDAAARRGAVVSETTVGDLPCVDASFDAVLSTFGVMFAPHQEPVIAELLRVCRPGGRIGLANWTPESFVGRAFRVIGRYVPPPDGVRSPVEWATQARVGALFGTDVERIVVRERELVLRYPSAQHWLDDFRVRSDPARRAFAALGAADRTALELDLLALADAHNTASSGVLLIPSEYLEVVAVKRGSSSPGASAAAPAFGSVRER